MNFSERVHGIFIETHRRFADSFNGYQWVDKVMVHEMLDTLKVVIMKAGAEFEDLIEAREAKKRKITGQKEGPSSSKAASDAQKARVQAAMNKQRMGE